MEEKGWGGEKSLGYVCMYVIFFCWRHLHSTPQRAVPCTSLHCLGSHWDLAPPYLPSRAAFHAEAKIHGYVWVVCIGRQRCDENASEAEYIRWRTSLPGPGALLILLMPYWTSPTTNYMPAHKGHKPGHYMIG